MSVLSNVGRGLGRVKALARDVRQFCFSASATVVAQGNARLGDVSRLSAVLGPQLRQIVDERIEELQQRLDELNCSLAEKAIPGDRRERVQQLSHTTAPKGRQNLRVVPSGEPKSQPAPAQSTAPGSRAAAPTHGPGAPTKTADSRTKATAKAAKAPTKAGAKSPSVAKSKSTKTSAAARKTSGKTSARPAAGKRATTPRKAPAAKSKGSKTSEPGDKK